MAYRMGFIYVADVMTTPAISVPTNAKFAEVVDRLVQSEVHAVPVIDAKGMLAGVISETDLVRCGGHGRALGLLADQLRGDKVDWAKKTTTKSARALMSRGVRAVSPNDDLATAAATMVEHDHHLLPVVDAHHVVIGVITRRDLLRRFEAEDAYIAAEIVEVLANARQAPAGLDVDVSVLGGIVSVRGTTERREDIAVVNHVIARVPGVLAIRSDLVVRDHPAATRSESPGWLARRAGAGTR